MSDDQYSDSGQQRWTLPKRSRMDGSERLHISSFVMAKNHSNQVLFLRASKDYPVSFKRGKLLLPATIVNYGENPRQVAIDLLDKQFSGVTYPKMIFTSMQSYLGAHWDLVVLFQAWFEGEDLQIQPREPFVQGGFYDVRTLPRAEIAGDHMEVIDSMLNPLEDE